MAKLPTRKRYLDLQGEGHVNADGSVRQDEILRCEPGERVTLRREPDNPHDPNAVAVDSSRGVCIGFLSRAEAAELAPSLDAGRHHSAVLHQLRGGFGDYPSYGARIEVAWDDKTCGPAREMDADQRRGRQGKIAAQGRERGTGGQFVGSKGTGCALALGLFTGALMAGTVSIARALSA